MTKREKVTRIHFNLGTPEGPASLCGIENRSDTVSYSQTTRRTNCLHCVRDPQFAMYVLIEVLSRIADVAEERHT